MAKFKKSAYTSKNTGNLSVFMNGRWVYYQVLAQSNPRGQILYEHAKSYIGEGGSVDNSLTDTSGIKNLRIVAKAEREKEIQLVKQNLKNFELPTDFWKNSDMFIEAINSLMQTRDVYLRNKERILGDDFQGKETEKGLRAKWAKIDVSSFFYTYFNNEIKAQLTPTSENAKRIGQAAAMDDIDEVHRIVDEMVYECFDNAIEKMLKSNVTGRKADDRRAYEAILEMEDSIKKLRRQGIYGKQIAEIYKLDEFVDGLTDYFINKKNDTVDERKGRMKKAKQSLAKSKFDIGGRAGNLSEVWATMITNELAKINFQTESISVVAERIGQLESKPDIMVSFGLDLDPIHRIMEEFQGEGSESISREKFVKMWAKIGAELEQFSKGFLVLENSKQYTLTENDRYSFYDIGFSGGSGGNLNALELILSKARGLTKGDVNATILTIMNTARGAIGEGLKGEMEAKLAEDIAYFLFDDINMIGKEYVEDSANVLHLLYLDGVYIPLSTLLELLANALEETINETKHNPTAYVQVEYDIPDVFGYNDEEEMLAQHEWDRQRNEVLADTKISVHFLKNFVEVLKNLTT